MELGARTLLAGMIAGAIAGFLWGGIGGRIAMRIVFLTSNGSVAGLESDDGFTIGVFSSAAVFLVAATTVLGAGLGAMVAVLRTPLRTGTAVAALVFAVASAAFFGSAIVHTDGIDFRFLDPLVLTVGLFVFLPAAWAASTIFLIDRLLRPKGRISRLPKPFLVLVITLAAIPLLAIGGSAIRELGIIAVAIVVGIAASGMAIVLRHSQLRSLAPTLAHWAVLAVLAALGVFGVIGLAEDIAGLT